MSTFNPEKWAQRCAADAAADAAKTAAVDPFYRRWSALFDALVSEGCAPTDRHVSSVRGDLRMHFDDWGYPVGFDGQRGVLSAVPRLNHATLWRWGRRDAFIVSQPYGLWAPPLGHLSPVPFYNVDVERGLSWYGPAAYVQIFYVPRYHRLLGDALARCGLDRPAPEVSVRALGGAA